MNQAPTFCSNCGSGLTPGKRFCEQCGAPVAAEPAAPASPPPQAQPAPAVQPPPVSRPPAPPSGLYPPAPAGGGAPAQKSKGCGGMGMWIGISVVIIGLLCVGVLGIGGLYLLSTAQATPEVQAPVEQASLPQPTAAQQNAPQQQASQPAAQPTQPPPTVVPASPTPALPSPTPAEPPLEISAGQALNDHSFSDDFETEYMMWSYGTDEEADWGYENGAYLIRIKISDQPLSFEPPITNFSPTAYEFDAAVSGKTGDGGAGTFGVLCDYTTTNRSNYVMVEVDPYGQWVAITQYVNSEPVATTEYLKQTNLNANPGASNHFLVECQWKYVTVFINNEWAAELETTEVMDSGMSLFIANWGPTDPDYFQVLIDNFSAWVPVQ